VYFLILILIPSRVKRFRPPPFPYKGLRCRWQTRATQRHINASHHGNQTISSTRPSCWIQISTAGVINSCPTTIRSLRHSPANYVDSAWDDQPFQRYVGVHQNQIGSRDLTTPLLGMVCHISIRGIALATVNLSTKFEVSNFTHYEDTKWDTKCRKWGGLGHSRSLKIALIDKAHTSSY